MSLPATTNHQETLCWSVSALVHAVSDTLKTRFAAITIRGEISSFSRATSGHCYFNLKDENAQLRCAMFQRAAQMLSFNPANGDEVEVRGRLAIYEQRGELQLIIEYMRPVGQGRLLEQFQQLKQKLSTEGLFDPKRKKQLPPYPQTIGLISSLQAAALHDVITTIKRRAPHVGLIVYPAAVQGAQAATELVKAIQTACTRKDVDVLLICRGGGSLEDLWSFNEEIVVRAIASCQIPIISGVGHETDFTLTDFVADVRAPTPTAAAELVSQTQQNLLNVVTLHQRQLQKELRHVLDQYAQRVDRAALALRQPQTLIQAQTQKLSQTKIRLEHAIQYQLQQKQQLLTVIDKQWPKLLQQTLLQQHSHLNQAILHWQNLPLAKQIHTATQKTQGLSSRLQWTSQQQLNKYQQHINHLEARLTSLNPEQILSRGYAWIQDNQGHVISSSKQLYAGQVIQAQFADGRAQATINHSEPDLIETTLNPRTQS